MGQSVALKRLLDALDLPLMQIFGSTYCNLKCPYCSQGDDRSSVKHGDLFSNDEFLSKLGNFPKTHFFISGGEPLIHEGIYTFLAKAAKHGHVVSVDTNGMIAKDALARILDALPREQWGFFNISHHLLAGAPFEQMRDVCSVLRNLDIPHFVKYVGAPESIQEIDRNMRILRDAGSGVAVTMLQTFSAPWQGRHFPLEYTNEELSALLGMVTLATHGIEFFGGIKSFGQPCLAGSIYIAYNTKDHLELKACCHRSDRLQWSDTAWGDNWEPSATPCNADACIGDLMFILGVQGLGQEKERLAEVCTGNSPAIGLEKTCTYIKSFAERSRLLYRERFDDFCKDVFGEGYFSVSNACEESADASAYPVSQSGKRKFTEFVDAYPEQYARLCGATKTGSANCSYYWDRARWPGSLSLSNKAKYEVNEKLGFPLKFNVEVTTLCTFKCEFCVYHSGRLASKRSQRFFSYADFKRFFDQVKFFITAIEFTGGEPFLNKDLHKMIALCNTYTVKTIVATNASMLTPDNIQQVLANPPSLLLVSYETGEPEVYAAHRVGGKIDRLNERIATLLELRNQRGQAYPKVRLLTLVSKKTVEHLDSFWRNAMEMGVDEAEFKPTFALVDGGEEHFALMKEKYLIPNHPLSYYKMDETGELLPTGIDGYCPNIQAVHIGADGSVIPCWCNVLASPSLGNVLQENFLDIWFSERVEKFHALMINHTAYEHACRYCPNIFQEHLFQKRVFHRMPVQIEGRVSEVFSWNAMDDSSGYQFNIYAGNKDSAIQRNMDAIIFRHSTMRDHVSTPYFVISSDDRKSKNFLLELDFPIIPNVPCQWKIQIQDEECDTLDSLHPPHKIDEIKNCLRSCLPFTIDNLCVSRIRIVFCPEIWSEEALLPTSIRVKEMLS